MFPIIYKCSIYFPLHCHFGHWSSETGYECRGNIKPSHLNQHKVQDYFLLSQRVRGQPSCGLRVIHPGAVSYSPAMQILQHCCISKIFRSLPCGTRYKIILIFQKEGLLQFGVQHDVSHRYVGGL